MEAFEAMKSSSAKEFLNSKDPNLTKQPKPQKQVINKKSSP